MARAGKEPNIPARARPARSTRSRLLVAAAGAPRFEAAASWLAALPRDAEALLVAASWHAADDLLRFVVRAGGTRFGVTRSTLERLAAQLAAPELARRGLAPASQLSLAAVAARAVHDLTARGRLSSFAPIAEKPGFPHAAARTFDDLRMAGVAPSALADRGGVGSDRAAIAARAEEELAAAGLADRALVFELARQAVEAGAATPVGLPLLLLDVPLESALDAALVAALARRAPDVLATAPAGDVRSIEGLAAALRCQPGPIENTDLDGSLAALQSHLFEVSEPRVRPLDSSVRLSSAPGEARECVEIVRAIQAEAADGVPFDRMAVLLRSPSEYRAHLEEAFRRAAIPAFFARGTSQPDPAGRAMLALLACASETLSARRFAEYLSLAQVPEPGALPDTAWAPPDHDLRPAPPETETETEVPPPAPPAEPDRDAVIEGGLRAPWRWERLLVDASVIGGRERWERRLRGLEAELRLQRSDLAEDDARAAGLDRVLADLAHLSAFALPLVDRLWSLPRSATWGKWLAALRDLAHAALRRPERVLATLAELEPMADVGPVDLDVVQQVLSPRLRDLSVPPERRRYGAVLVAPAQTARGMAFDVVWVPGLAERLFPRKITEDPLLGDAERRALDGGALATQETRVAAERLMLRLAAGAASRRLYLSYPRLDAEQGRPRVPSFYGLEALRAAEGRLPGFDDLRRRAEAATASRLGWPAPERAADAVDDAEYDLAVLASLRDADPEATVGAASYLLEVNPALARALRARMRRWQGLWTSFDGLVPPHEKESSRARASSDPAEVHALALEALRSHRLDARSFSPTALENFSVCPYRFFLQAIHRLEPRDDPVALEAMDPLTRGALFHEVQFELLTRLRRDGLLPLAAAGLAAGFDAVDEAVAQVAARYADRLCPAIPRVWEDGVAAIRADLREWMRRAAESGTTWVPHRFELAFGLADRHRPNADPASVPDPVRVLDRITLRGSIDLVEKQSGGEALRVTDHKTGKARAPEGVAIGGGKVLQPLLYALAAGAVLKAPVTAGRLYYCTADGGFAERVVPLDDHGREAVAEVAAIVGSALERGFLPALPEPGACFWCDYRAVCGPWEEIRTARKPREPLADLERLRKMP